MEDKKQNENVAHGREKGALVKREQEKRKKRKKRKKEEAATRRERSHKKREKGENDIKEEQVEKGLRTSPHKSAQKWKEPSKW